MNKVLVLYPEEFKCYSKFSRKIDFLTGNVGSIKLITPSDPNGMTEKYGLERSIEVVESEVSASEPSGITHAVIFDDGEVYQDVVLELRAKGLKVRYNKIDITRVVNIKKSSNWNGRRSTIDYEYIGRGSIWGNPYSIQANGDDRMEVIRKFKYDFDKYLSKEEPKLFELSGKRLGCFCKPSACHGDVIADFLNSWDDGR